MGKRAPALGRKVKPGPVTHIEQPEPCPWCERYHGGRHCVSYGTYVTPTTAIPLEAKGKPGRPQAGAGGPGVQDALIAEWLVKERGR